MTDPNITQPQFSGERGGGGGAYANKGIVQSPLTVNRALVVLRPCQQFFRYIIGRTLF